jgi:hypothetical protein
MESFNLSKLIKVYTEEEKKKNEREERKNKEGKKIK